MPLFPNFAGMPGAAPDDTTYSNRIARSRFQRFASRRYDMATNTYGSGHLRGGGNCHSGPADEHTFGHGQLNVRPIRCRNSIQPPGGPEVWRREPAGVGRHATMLMRNTDVPVRRDKPVTSAMCRDGVDAAELTRRLNIVRAQRAQRGEAEADDGSTAYVPSQAATQAASQFAATAATTAPNVPVSLGRRASQMALASEAQDRAPPVVQHAFEDTQEVPGARRTSTAMLNGYLAGGAGGEANTSSRRGSSASNRASAVQPAEYARVVQEHTTDWTQSDESAPAAKPHHAQGMTDADRADAKTKKAGSRLRRLRERISTFSRETLAALPTENVMANGKSRHGSMDSVPALASPSASSPASSVELSQTQSKAQEAQEAQEARVLDGQMPTKMAATRSSDRFLAIFR